MPKKKKPRVVLRKKVSVGHPMTLVDRPSTYSLTNPRAVERYLDAMTLHSGMLHRPPPDDGVLQRWKGYA